MLKTHQINSMIQLQDKLNSSINPDWVVAQNDWMMAGALELAEAIDHYGWKWWKKQTPNLPLFQNELVDYFHFVLSQSIIHGDGDLKKAFYFVSPRENDYAKEGVNFDGSGYLLAELSVIEKCFLLMGLAASGRFEFYLFESLLQDAEMSWDELYKQYVSKNMLNIFRQEHGYKDGSYVKTWFDGREDNSHMIDVMREFEHKFYEPEYIDILRLELKALYSKNFIR